MNRKSLALAGFSVAAGVVGLILRRLQLLRYDAQTGLFQSGGVASAMLIFVLTAASEDEALSAADEPVPLAQPESIMPAMITAATAPL